MALGDITPQQKLVAVAYALQVAFFVKGGITNAY